MKVIAIKRRKVVSNPTLGYVKPIFTFNEELEEFQEATIEMFPNDGEIFIIRDYNLIDELDEDELFELNDIFINRNNYEESRNGSCYYTATANHLRYINNTEFLPILPYKFNLKNRKIEFINLSEHQIFFLEDEKFIFGPFSFNSTIKELTAININELDLKENDDDYNLEDQLREQKDCIFKIPKDDIQDVLIGNYIHKLIDVINLTNKETVYFGSKENVFEWGKEVLKLNISEQERALLDKLSGTLIPKFGNNIDKVKLELFKSSLIEANSWLNVELPKHLHGFLMTDEGISYVNNYLEDNKVSFFNTYKKEEIENIEKEIDDKNSELEKLNLMVIDLNNSLESQENKIFDGIAEEEKDELKNIIKNPEERALLIKYFKQNKDLEEIQTLVTQKHGERNVLQTDIDDFKRQKGVLQEAIRNVKSEFFKDSDFAKKLIDAKIYTDLLNNIDPSASSDVVAEPIAPIIYKISNDILKPKQFILEVASRLRKSNRRLSYNDVANHLITLSQNFLTIYAGLPGVGKTSLIQKYSSVLGLQSNNKYLTIAVPRGWTSSKDLLGYFNPMRNKFQYSKTGLTQFLEACQRDAANKSDVLSLVLLDEANMSSIEHYWSDFLTVSDKDFEKSISKSNSEKIIYGSNLRFIATINYDHTTEVLSDRLISRAPVIKLTQTDYNLEEEFIEEIYSEMFSFKQFDFFNNLKTERENFKGDIRNKFDSIVKVLQDETVGGQPIILGMRKYKAIESYCNVAIAVMEFDDANKFIPLDYAVNQFILPLINGRGDGFLKKLESLQEKLKGMPISYNQLSNIISYGNDNFKNFKFFY